MSLADDLAQPTAKEPQHQPRTVFDGREGFLQTRPVLTPPDDFTALLREFGHDPKQVRIVGEPRISRWQRYDGEWLTSYRYHLAAVNPALPDFTGLFRKRARPAVSEGVAVFNMQAADLQLGKDHESGGGPEETIDAYRQSVEQAIKQYKLLRRSHKIGAINLMFPGDCIEGTFSQGGKNLWRTTLTVTEQVRIFRRLLAETVDAFAPLSDQIWLRVVNGNHDEANRLQNTRADDGWATEAAISVSDALKGREAYQHVTVEVPPLDQGWMTVDALGTVFTIAHGHQWRRGKAMQWLANQTLHATNASATHVLAHGHEHRWTVDTNNARTVICTPALDGGSAWLQDGSAGLRGSLVYVTENGAVSNMSVV